MDQNALICLKTYRSVYSGRTREQRQQQVSVNHQFITVLMWSHTTAKHYSHIQKKQSNTGIQWELSFSPPVEWRPMFPGTSCTASSANSKTSGSLASWLFDCIQQPLTSSGSPPFNAGQKVCAAVGFTDYLWDLVSDVQTHWTYNQNNWPWNTSSRKYCRILLHILVRCNESPPPLIPPLAASIFHGTGKTEQ